MYRCKCCDYSESTPSVYHSSLAGVNSRKLSYVEELNEWYCNECLYYAYDHEKKEEGELDEYDIESDS